MCNYLKGSWTWQKSCGGIAGLCSYPSTQGSKEVMFTRINGVSDSISYKFYKNGNLFTSSGSRVQKVQGNWKIRVTDLSMEQYIYQAPGDTLILNDVCIDCHSHHFYRTKPVNLKNLAMERTLTVYPNPTTGLLKVDLNAYFSSPEYSIYSTEGQLIRAGFLKSGYLDLEELKPGFYFIKIPIGDVIYQGKFLKN